MSEQSYLKQAVPNLPARDLSKTAAFYREKLGFRQVGGDYPDYLMLARDGIALHFYLHKDLDPLKDAGVCYIYVDGVEALYRECQAAGVVHPNGRLELTPWKMYEFVALDLDNNALRIGQSAA